MRWLVDHFAADRVLGTDLTRRLVATSLAGVANVETVTGRALLELVPEWQMTNYLDDLSGFQPPPSRLQYKTLGLSGGRADSIGRPFPLAPDNHLRRGLLP